MLILVFTDNILTVARSKQELQVVLYTLEKAANKIDLVINED